MTESEPIPLLAAGVIVTALLVTFLIQGGWLIWIPIAITAAVVFWPDPPKGGGAATPWRRLAAGCPRRGRTEFGRGMSRLM